MFSITRAGCLNIVSFILWRMYDTFVPASDMSTLNVSFMWPDPYGCAERKSP